MPDYETIQFELRDRIARITLNRPDRLNSFTAQMHHELREVLHDHVGESRVIVLTGAGRGFCAGQDLSDRAVSHGDQPVDLGNTVENSWNPLVRRLASLPQPVIARHMFGGFGAALQSCSLHFVSRAGREGGALNGLSRPLSVVGGCRNIGKRDLHLNDALPRIDVNPDTYEVRADGELMTSDPAEVLPLAQRYFLF